MNTYFMKTFSYRNFINESSIGFAYYRLITDEKSGNHDCMILDVNNSYETITGLKRENIIGRRLTEILPAVPVNLSENLRLYCDSVTKNEYREFDYYSDNLNIWYHVQIYPHEDHSFITFYFDVTKLKNTEKQLRDTTLVLGEKIMGMNLLIYLSQLINKKGVTIHDILKETVTRMPFAFSSSGIICSSIRYGDESFTSAEFRASSLKLSSDIMVGGNNEGSVEVFFTEGTVLSEKLSSMNNEQIYLATIARYLGQFIEKIRFNEELEQSRKKLLQYMTYAPDGIFISDREGRYIAVNPAACSLLGYTENELLQMAIPDIVPPDMKNEGIASFRNVVETGSDKREMQFLRKDGNRLWIALEAVSLPDGTFMAFCKDISDRKKAERELAESLNFNRTLLDTMPVPVFYKDYNGRFLGANRSFVNLYELGEDELKGKTVFDIAPDEYAGIYNKMDKELLSNPGIQIYESLIMDNSGNEHNVIFHKGTFNDVEGNIGGIIGVILDITKRKEAEQELELYFRAMQSIDQPVLITDSDACIIRVNNAFIQMYGYTLEEISGKNPRILNPGKNTYLNFGYEEEEYDNLFKSMWEAISDSEKGTWEGIVINRKKDGSLIWIKLLINTIYNEEHVPVNFIALPIDISGSVHSETISKIQLYRTIAALAELRDNETGNHMRRVGIFAKLLAREHGMPEKYCEDIEIFAPMHDIGKVGITDSILLAERKLTPEEFEIMKTHTVLGHNIVKGNKELEMVAAITVAHHEKYDGSGYPRGLQGEDIPLSARITAIADVYDALRSSRPYKNEWHHEEVKKYIIDNSGTHFDPVIVSHFIRIRDRFDTIYNDLRD